LLAESAPFSYLHEPLHAERGIEGIDNWFPFIPVEATASHHVATSVAALLAGKARYKRTLTPQAARSIGIRFISSFVHNRSHLDFLVHRYLHPGRALLLKDVSFALCMAWILRNYPGSKAVIMIRHPVAVALSMAKQKWRFDDSCLWGQPELVRQFLLPLGIPRTTDLNPDLQIAWAWRSIYSILLAQLEDADPDRYLFVRHVDVCLSPVETGQRILAFAGVEMNSNARKYLASRTNDTRVEGREGVVHDLSRDSRKLAIAWKSKASPETIEAVLAVAEPVFSRLNSDATKLYGAA
jgi:hypothetical protein